MANEELNLRLDKAERLLDKLIERDKERAKEQAADDARRREEDARRKEEDARRKEESDQRSQKIDRQLAELGKQIGGLHNRWGKIVEDLVAGELVAIVQNFMGASVHYVSTRVRPKDRSWEIDVLAVNNGVVVVTEVKTTLTEEKVDHFLSRIMLPFTTLIPEHKNKKIYGIIAFIRVDGNESEVVNYAWSKGLLVVKAMDGANRVLTSDDFVLRDYGRGSR